MSRPMLFFLHALGMSGREWSTVIDALSPDIDGVPLDLPGFGSQADLGAHSLDRLVDWTVDQIKARSPTSWAIVGHSMGGKIASLVAARSSRGEAGLSGCLGVILVAASPPSPEPMDEERRQRMIGWFTDGPPRREDAEAFLEANIAGGLDSHSRNLALDDIQRTHPAAWIDWLRNGSREDRSADVGELRVPAMIVAGADDGDLGEAAQRRLNLPHLPKAGDVQVIPGCAHLIPLEQPRALAELVRHAMVRWTERRLPDAMVALLDSDRVSVDERARLLARHHGPAQASLLSANERATLQALAGQVLGPDVDAVDMANRIEAALVDREGDGWRFAELPDDLDAWPRALRTVEQWFPGFALRGADAQADALRAIVDGAPREPSPSADGLTVAQMQRWSEDLRADLARTWASLPRTWSEMGYDGFALGNADGTLRGYAVTGANQAEPWQLSPESRHGG
ncbi:alpha/beta fold hydrolase [Luteibacter sp. CQ10]|uniref:alpha/beta fold hydrolase n=1 Tax=Luteibacter sp. CQ10 TaxID=2805821 RepID=UPI0034A40E37